MEELSGTSVSLGVRQTTGSTNLCDLDLERSLKSPRAKVW